MKFQNSSEINGKKGSERNDRVWLGRCPRASQPGPGRHPATVVTSIASKSIAVGRWNVRTLLDSPNSERAERRTALIAKELKRYSLDIVALSDTRLSEEGNLKEELGDYIFFWRGKNKKLRC